MKKAFFTALVAAAAMMAAPVGAQVVTDACDTTPAATNAFPFSVNQNTTTFVRDSYFTLISALTGKDAGYAFSVSTPTVVQFIITHELHDVNRRVTGVATGAVCPPGVAGFDPPMTGFYLSSPSTGTGNTLRFRAFCNAGQWMLTFGSRVVANSNAVISASGTAITVPPVDQSVSGARTVTLTGNDYFDFYDTSGTNGQDAPFDLTPFGGGFGPDGPTVLYSFTPPTTDTYNINCHVADAPDGGDTVIIVWSTPVGSLSPTTETAPDVVAYVDDFGSGGESAAGLNLNSGTTYTIAASGWLNDMSYGNVVFSVNRTAAAVQDWTVH